MVCNLLILQCATTESDNSLCCLSKLNDQFLFSLSETLFALFFKNFRYTHTVFFLNKMIQIMKGYGKFLGKSFSNCRLSGSHHPAKEKRLSQQIVYHLKSFCGVTISTSSRCTLTAPVADPFGFVTYFRFVTITSARLLPLAFECQAATEAAFKITCLGGISF